METISSADAMNDFAKRFMETDLAHVDATGATVLALSGDLGAGKTTFTQALARAFGVTESVVSPTFMVMKRYALSHASFDNLIHIDAYRIEDEREVEVLRIPEVMNDPRNLVVVEWAERISACIPPDAISMTLAHGEDETRTITYNHA